MALKKILFPLKYISALYYLSLCKGNFLFYTHLLYFSLSYFSISNLIQSLQYPAAHSLSFTILNFSFIKLSLSSKSKIEFIQSFVNIIVPLYSEIIYSFFNLFLANKPFPAPYIKESFISTSKNSEFPIAKSLRFFIFFIDKI
jgi:hypothetical protein